MRLDIQGLTACLEAFNISSVLTFVDGEHIMFIGHQGATEYTKKLKEARDCTEFYSDTQVRRIQSYSLGQMYRDTLGEDELDRIAALGHAPSLTEQTAQPTLGNGDWPTVGPDLASQWHARLGSWQ